MSVGRLGPQHDRSQDGMFPVRDEFRVTRVLSRKFLEAICMGGAHSEHKDFAKSARRDIIGPFHMKMHF